MSPETQKALEAFVLQIIDAAKVGATWSADQAPVLVQQWLAYQWYSTVLALSIFGLLAIVCILLFLKGWLSDHFDSDVPCVLGAIGTAICLVLACFQIDALVKLSVAPNVMVFEKFIQIIK